MNCPYTEPRTIIKYGSKGMGAKWMQWMLNQYGYGLEIDGDIGKLSNAALLDFQAHHNLDVDGQCGAKTRAALKAGNAPMAVQKEEPEPPAYTNSKMVTYTSLSPHRSARSHAIDTISIHHMAGRLSVETCGVCFRTTRAASSNYGICDDNVGMYVPESDRSVCSSSTANDNRAVTIECSNSGAGYPWPISAATEETLIQLCVDICKRNKFPYIEYHADKSGIGKPWQITVHRWFVATQCPGDYLMERLPKICEEINKRLGVSK